MQQCLYNICSYINHAKCSITREWGVEHTSIKQIHEKVSTSDVTMSLLAHGFQQWREL